MKRDQISSEILDSKADMKQGSSRFYGWTILSVLWLLFMNFSLMVYGGSVLNAYMARGLNMPRDSFGGGVSIAYLLMGLGAPLTALIVNKIRPRLTLFAGMMLMAIGSAYLGIFVRNAAGFTIGFGLFIGMGLSIGGLLPLQTLVANWFVRRRSLATAVLLSSGGVGGLLASYLFSFLIDKMQMSWQMIWLLLSGFSLLMALMAIFLLRNQPAEMTQMPDGDHPGGSKSKESQVSTSRVYQTDEEWTFKEAMKTPAVWLILLGTLGMAVSYEFCSSYGVIHLMDIGFANIIASFSIGTLSFFAIVGRLATGYLGDRFELRWLMVIGSILIAVGCLLIIAPSSPGWITMYAMLAGLGQGLVFVSVFTIMPNYFGVKVLPSILAVGMPFTALATAGIIYLGGVIRAQSGSYASGFILCAALAFVAALCAFAAKPPKASINQ